MEPINCFHFKRQFYSSSSCSPHHHQTNHTKWLQYLTRDVWDYGADSRTAQFPLMNGGPWKVLAILGLYLLFVRYYGPRLMRNRSAFDLKWPILVYNAIMMMVNFYFFIMASRYTRFGYDSWGCTPIDSLHNNNIEWAHKLRLIWWFFITKFIDLCETIFFILRKKNSQASTLHVVHHFLVPLDVWFGLKYSATTSAAFFPFINSFVHSIMYFYYALSTFGPAIRPYLWWKKYLTQLQIFQLLLIAIHCLHLCLLPNCDLPKQIFAIYLPQAILLVYMFVTFFMRTYLKGKVISKKIN